MKINETSMNINEHLQLIVIVFLFFSLIFIEGSLTSIERH